MSRHHGNLRFPYDPEALALFTCRYGCSVSSRHCQPQQLRCVPREKGVEALDRDLTVGDVGYCYLPIIGVLLTVSIGRTSSSTSVSASLDQVDGVDHTLDSQQLLDRVNSQ